MQQETVDMEARASGPAFWAWLTVERALYGALFMAALLVRLVNLGPAPLLKEELPTALAAWGALNGTAPGATGYVPLLLYAQVVLFVLRSGPFAARVFPALAGAGLVLLPWLGRKALGRTGALAAAALLTFSPGWVYASRVADGALLSVALGVAALALGWRYYDTGDQRDARMAVVALAASLTAGAAVYTALTAAPLLAILWWRRLAVERRALLTERLRAARCARAPLVLCLSLLALATALWLNPSGLGATADLAGVWARSLAPAATDLPWHHLLRVLAIYEPLILLLATVGSYYGLRRRWGFDLALLLWLAYALVLGVALGQRDPPWLLGALLPLTLLAARGAQALAETAPALEPGDLAPLLLGLGLLGFGYLQFAYYARSQEVLFAIYGCFSLAILALGLVGYGIWVRPAAARRAALLLLGLVLVIPGARGMVAIAFDRARDPWEPLLHRPTAAALSELDALLRTVSLQRAGDERILDVLYEEALGPQIAWALREFPNASATLRVGAQPTATVVITGPRTRVEWPQGYAGQALVLWEEPTDMDEDWLFRLQWLLYRQPGPQAEQRLFWIWVRMPTDG